MVITSRPKPKRSDWMLTVLAVILTCALGVAIAQSSPTVGRRVVVGVLLLAVVICWVLLIVGHVRRVRLRSDDRSGALPIVGGLIAGLLFVAVRALQEHVAWAPVIAATCLGGVIVTILWAARRKCEDVPSYLKLDARYYNPTTARFTQPDPAHTCGGYAYAGDDPANNTDPTGRSCLAAGLAGGAVGFVGGAVAASPADIPTVGLASVAAGIDVGINVGLGAYISCELAGLLSSWGL